MTKTLVLVLSGLLFCACGDDDSVTDSGPATPDATEGMDAGPGDDDAGPDEEDAGPDEEDAGPITTDAGPQDVGVDAPSSPDAGPMCLLNSDCPDTDLCAEVEPGTEMSFCIPGERGTTPYGDACTTSEQCVSGACLEDFCTQECAAEDACPNDNLPRCSPGLGLCVPAAE
ncbi:MAG: hypothetical protein AB8H86_04155 [Polyangiales bacterium]